MGERQIVVEADNYEEAFMKLVGVLKDNGVKIGGEDVKVQVVNSREEADTVLAEFGRLSSEAKDFDYTPDLDTATSAEERPVAPEVKAKEEGCEDGPVKGKMDIHVHEDGSVGFDIAHSLSELEIIGALQYTLAVFEEQRNQAIRANISRQRAGGLDEIMNKLFKNVKVV